MPLFESALFRTPPSANAPVYAWPWNGPITRELIDRELDEMLSFGIRSVYVIPMPADFRPNNMRTPLSPGYLTDAFFELIAYAARAAKARDMTFWLYDEGGWPSGSADRRVVALEPDLIRQDLVRRAIRLPAGVAYRPAHEVIAAFSDGARVYAGERFDTDRRLDEYCAKRAAATALANPLDGRATELFIHLTHERYAAALGGLSGSYAHYMFTDEPGAHMPAWRDDLPELFMDEYGYDLTGRLPAIFEPEKFAAPEDEQTRIDYYTLCGQLFREQYLRPIRDWCRSHGMALCGHLNREDSLHGARQYGYGGLLAALRIMDMPGVDLIWRQLTAPDMTASPQPAEIPFFTRFASSAARQNGGRLCVSESFNIFGAGLTWDQTRAVANGQFVRGLTVLNGMNVPANRERVTPLAMRPCYTPEVPGIGHMRALNALIDRTQYLLQLGDATIDTALYIPDRDELADGETARRAADSFREKGLALERAGIDFDLIDDEAIRLAVLEDGALRIGKAAYRRVVAPECRHMPADVAEKLNRLAPFAPRPVIQCGNAALRARRIALENGDRLYFIVNEGGSSCVSRVRFDEGAPDDQLALEEGEIRRPEIAESGETVVRLEGGQACAFLFTNAALETAPEYRDIYTRTLHDFTFAPVSAYKIDDMGIRRDEIDAPFEPAALGGWRGRLGEAFSGEVHYRARIEPETPVQPGDVYRLSLGRVAYSARVLVNGAEAALAAMPPFEATFPAPQGAFELTIEVANTPANEIVHTDVIDRWPKDEIGVYHEKTLLFERESLDGGLYGPVTLTLARPV